MFTCNDNTWRRILASIIRNRFSKKKSILNYFNFFVLFKDGIKRLIALLKMTDNALILSILSVLCNISTNKEVREAISTVEEDLAEMFSKLLKCNNDEIRSKTSILIADICFISSNQVKTDLSPVFQIEFLS